MMWLDVIFLIVLVIFALVVFSVEVLNALAKFAERSPRRTELISTIKPLPGALPFLSTRGRRRLFPFFQ